MKIKTISSLAFATLSLMLGVTGCAADPSQDSRQAPAEEAVDTTEHELSVVPSTTHPAASNGRIVESWHTSLTRGGSFRVRGVTQDGETVAEFVFKPDAAGVAVESIAPERGVIRIVDGEVTERFTVSAPTQALYEAMGKDLEALEGVPEDAANGVSPKGWWGCTKATAKVTYHCAGSAVKIIACLRKLDSASGLSACVVGVGTSCKNAASNWVSECL